MEYQELIYKNGHSRCVAEFDGEIVRIIQTIDEDVVSDTFLYVDELEKIVSFVKSISK